MLKKITSLASTVLLIVAVIAGVSVAFFSDTESSTGNTFSAGAIDLLVDNDSYYNGNRCVNNAGEGEPEDWRWNDGGADYPVPGTPCTTSWNLDNLSEGYLFFNFLDLKPGDEGEDTISLHVQNEAWACMDITLTSDAENGVNEPEEEAGDNPNENGDFDGELGGLIEMIWWADDGDNVLEEGEPILVNGEQPLSITELFGGDNLYSVALADSENNAWGLPGGTPLPADTSYIAKAWCFGTMTVDPEPQDSNDGPQDRPSPGYSCSGEGIGNESQTDSVTLDVQFSAVQARHNPGFMCENGDCEFDPEVNLVFNGGFESPEVDTDENWDIFDSVAGGWTVEWRGDIQATFEGEDRPDIAHLELHRGVLGTAGEGDQYAELDSDWDGPGQPLNGEPASVVIYQDIPTTPGATYNLRFQFAARPNTVAGQNVLEVMWDGNIVHTEGPTGDPNAGIEWVQIDILVVATGPTTRIQFIDQGTADSLGTFLDDVEVFQLDCTGEIFGEDPQIAN